MGLYDVLEEMTEKKETKTETGDSRIYGVMLGVVAKNYDQTMPGKICVTIPTRESGSNELQWVRQVHPSGGSSWGHYFLPEVGDQVLLAFEGGHIEKPYVIGCVAKDNDSFMTGSVDINNKYKKIITKNGSKIVFEDVKEGEGSKDKITLETATSAHTLLLDNENNIIRLSDKAKLNMVELKTQEGTMAIKAKSKITISVGETITITLNGESGSVKIEASDITLQATNQIKAITDGVLKLEGAQVMQKGSSTFKAESGGVAQLVGSVIKIG